MSKSQLVPPDNDPESSLQTKRADVLQRNTEVWLLEDLLKTIEQTSRMKEDQVSLKTPGKLFEEPDRCKIEGLFLYESSKALSKQREIQKTMVEADSDGYLEDFVKKNKHPTALKHQHLEMSSLCT